MALYEIPLGPSPRRMRIPLGATTYNLAFDCADAPDAGWFMDIADAHLAPLICGLPLVTGLDLLEPYPDLGIGGRLFVVTDADPGAVPTANNLGVGSHLLFEPTP